MVEVWIKHEVSFRKLERFARSRESQVKDNLRNLLEGKIYGERDKIKEKAESFQFSSLIDMTVKFFDISTNNQTK